MSAVSGTTKVAPDLAAAKVLLMSVFFMLSQDAAPSPPPPTVINKYSDEQLRAIIRPPLHRKDQYTKVVEERKQQAAEEQKKKEDEEKKKKQEQEKKKEDEQRKKKEKEKEKKTAQSKVKKKLNIKSRLSEAVWISVDAVLKPVEDRMDSVLGKTNDPFTDRHYIAWLSLVTLAFNYNTWFLTARLCFPFHTESTDPSWFTLDVLADLMYLTDSIIF
ncbi:hypothetical protein Q8A73_020203 [Channa argus]|nr:hypothetical protein Q8A73_020203 [Channa argus]